MQKASEQTGKLANSGRRFTDEEPRYSLHFDEIFLAQKNIHLPFRLSLPLQSIFNKQFRNLSQNARVLTMTKPWINKLCGLRQVAFALLHCEQALNRPLSIASKLNNGIQPYTGF